MLTIDVPTIIHPDRIADMVITAFEGGANHWILTAVLKHGTSTERPYYADPKLYENEFAILIETVDHETVILNGGTAKRGFELMAEQFESTHWADFLEANEDADTADVWLQLALLGDVTYG